MKKREQTNKNRIESIKKNAQHFMEHIHPSLEHEIYYIVYMVFGLTVCG